MVSIIPTNSESFAPGAQNPPLTIQTLTAPVEIKKEPVNTGNIGIIFDRVIEDNKTKISQTPVPTLLSTNAKIAGMGIATGRTEAQPSAVLIGPGATPINVTAPVTGAPVTPTPSGKTMNVTNSPGVEETVTSVINTVNDLVAGRGIMAPATAEALSKAAKEKADQAAPTKKDNTATYLAIGAGIIVVCGLIYWYFKK